MRQLPNSKSCLVRYNPAKDNWSVFPLPKEMNGRVSMIKMFSDGRICVLGGERKTFVAILDGSKWVIRQSTASLPEHKNAWIETLHTAMKNSADASLPTEQNTFHHVEEFLPQREVTLPDMDAFEVGLSSYDQLIEGAHHEG